MSKIHIGLVVADLEKSKAFYSALFGETPVVEKDDYAKWAPDALPVNFSVTDRQESAQFGAVHFGIEAQGDDELAGIVDRLEQAADDVTPESEAVCCYHKSKKVWGVDPDAFLWEAFFTHDQHARYGEDNSDLKAARDRILLASGASR